MRPTSAFSKVCSKARKRTSPQSLVVSNLRHEGCLGING